MGHIQQRSRFVFPFRHPGDFQYDVLRFRLRTSQIERTNRERVYEGVVHYRHRSNPSILFDNGWCWIQLTCQANKDWEIIQVSQVNQTTQSTQGHEQLEESHLKVGRRI